MSNIDAVLDKVRKLRALSSSSNEHEAAAAAAAADRLIQQHRLDESVLEAEGKDPEAPVVDAELIDSYGRKVPSWRSMLLAELCHLHGCTSYIVTSFDGISGARIVGRPSDTATVRFLLRWIAGEIDRLALGYAGRGRTWLNSYRHGAASGCVRAMRAAAEEVRESAAPTTLVRVDDREEAALACLAAKVGKLHSAREHTATMDRDGYARGRRDGENISPARQIGDGS